MVKKLKIKIKHGHLHKVFIEIYGYKFMLSTYILKSILGQFLD